MSHRGDCITVEAHSEEGCTFRDVTEERPGMTDPTTPTLVKALNGTLMLAEMYHDSVRHHSHEPGDPSRLTDTQVEGVPAGKVLTRKACDMCITIVAAREAIEALTDG